MSPTDMDAVLDVVDDALDEAGLAARASYTADAGDDPDAGVTDEADPGDTIKVLDQLEEAGQGAPAHEPAHDQAEAAAAEPPPVPQRVLELRILSGMHAGARAPLQGKDYLLGTLDDCDFVLEDAGVQPHHARLSRCTDTDEGCGESGWQLDWVAHEGGEPLLAPTRLVHGTAVPIGPIVVAVDEPGAPWPTLEQLVLVPHAPALEPSLPVPTDAPAQDRAWVRRLRTMPRRRVVAALTAATLGLSGAAAALVAWPVALGGSAADAAAPASAAAPAPVAPDPAQRQAIEAALASRGLAGRARIEPAGAAWLVRAPVMSDMDGEALATALSRLQPRPVLRLPTEQELHDEVAEAVPRLAGEHAGAIKLRAMGPGRLRLEGRLANAGQRDTLLRTVAEAFPQTMWDNAVLTNEEASAELLAELRTRGWQASGEWKNDALQVQVTLQQRDVPNWEQTLVAVNRTHAVPLRATMAFAQSAPTPSPAPRGVESRLPFQLRGVVGGDMPYVLLSDGDKLSQGGVWKGWRLASISANQVVFENGAQRAVLTR